MALHTELNALDPISSVGCMIERLQKLKDYKEIHSAISVVRTLESQVYSARQSLEEKSITVSSLRHTLGNLKTNLSLKLDAAKKDAWISMETEVNSLKKNYDDLSKEITFCETKETALKLHCDMLEREKETLEIKFKSVKKSFNDSLSKKACYLQSLAETKRTIHETKEKIGDLKEKTATLKQNLVEAREVKEKEEQILSKEMNALEECIKKGETELHGKKEDLFALEQDLAIEKSNAAEQEGLLRNLALQAERLKEQEVALVKACKSLEDGIRQEKLQSNKILKEREIEKEKFKVSLEEVMKQIPQVSSEIENVQRQKSSFVKENKALRNELKEAQIGLESEKIGLLEAKERLQKMKDTLLFQAEESARLSKEEKVLEKKLVKIKESHRATVETFKTQMEDLRSKVTFEKKARQDSQAKYSDFQKKSISEKRRLSQKLTDLTHQVAEAKKCHESLKKKDKVLTENTNELMERMESLEEEIVNMTVACKEAQEEAKEDKKSLLNDHQKWLQTAVHRNAQLEHLEPLYAKLSEDLTAGQTLYDNKQHEIIEKKKKEKDLMKEIARAEVMYMEHVKEKKGLQRSIARVQGCLVHDVAENKIEVAKVEISHKKLATKLRSMELENRRMREEIEGLRDFQKILEQLVDRKNHKDGLEDKLKDLSVDLSEMKSRHNLEWKNLISQQKEKCSQLDSLAKTVEENVLWVNTAHGALANLSSKHCARV